MSKRIAKIAFAILIILILVYAGYQAFSLYPSYKTEVALIEAVQDAIPATGIVVRDETIVADSGVQGVRNYLVSNGDKVAKGSNIAEIYRSAEDALDSLMLELLRSELDILEQISGQGHSGGANLDSVISRIRRLLDQISTEMARGNYADLEQQRLQLLELLNGFAQSSGQELDVSVRILELKAEIAVLESRDVMPIGHMQAPSEGYFISTVDGYESLINRQTVLDMPVEEIAALAAGDQLSVSSESCKIVSDYIWYYAAVIDAGYANRFSKDMKLTLDFSYSSVNTLPVTVVDVKTEQGSQKAVVVVRCDILTAELTGLRCESATLSFRNYSGFIIDRTALRMENGVLGVYIKYGTRVEFKRVIVIYSTDDYIVSQPDPSDSSVLAMYDEIIIEGRDLYAGKELLR